MSSDSILVVDNYDSFVHTIVGYLRELGARVRVIRNDDPLPDVAAWAGLLVSPGPGAPADAGISIEAILACARAGVPMLGVCLGHQALAEAFGARVAHAPELRHGKTSEIAHDGLGVFAALPSPLRVTRYHSLAVVPETLPGCLVASASAGDVIMGLRHESLPLESVQFHPESVLTEGGYQMLGNWLASCGVARARDRAKGRAPLLA